MRPASDWAGKIKFGTGVGRNGHYQAEKWARELVRRIRNEVLDEAKKAISKDALDEEARAGRSRSSFPLDHAAIYIEDAWALIDALKDSP